MSEGTEPFSYRQSVRFGDIDALQHMNNVEYLRFVESARIEYMRVLLPDYSPVGPRQFGFILAESHIVYRAPALMGEVIRTTVRTEEPRRSSVTLPFEMRVEEDERLVAEGYAVLVGYDYERGRAQPIPDPVRERLEEARLSAA